MSSLLRIRRGSIARWSAWTMYGRLSSELYAVLSRSVARAMQRHVGNPTQQAKLKQNLSKTRCVVARKKECKVVLNRNESLVNPKPGVVQL